MIHTNEPANQFYVFLTAYRAVNSLEVNELHLKGMISEIRKYTGLYGVIESTEIQGCFREKDQEVATVERTIKVRCRNEIELQNVTFLACKRYDQDAVLVVNSQTHTASLAHIEMEGDYPYSFPVYTQGDALGTLQAVEKVSGECYSIDGNTLLEVI